MHLTMCQTYWSIHKKYFPRELKKYIFIFFKFSNCFLELYSLLTLCINPIMTIFLLFVIFTHISLASFLWDIGKQ